jgi:hypothetical protein
MEMLKMKIHHYESFYYCLFQWLLQENTLELVGLKSSGIVTQSWWLAGISLYNNI